MEIIATRPTTTPAAMPAVLAVFEPGSGVADCEANVLSGAVTTTVLVGTNNKGVRVELLSGIWDGESDVAVVILELGSGL